MNSPELHVDSPEAMEIKELVDGPYSVVIEGHYEEVSAEAEMTPEAVVLAEIERAEPSSQEAYPKTENNSHFSVRDASQHDLVDFRSIPAEVLAQITEQQVLLHLTKTAKPIDAATVRGLRGDARHANNFEAIARNQ